MNKAQNAIRDHLSPKDVQGAVRDILGNPVSKSKGDAYQHLTEVNDGLGSLRNGMDALRGAISAKTTPAQKATLENALSKMSKYHDDVRGTLRRAEKKAADAQKSMSTSSGRVSDNLTSKTSP